MSNASSCRFRQDPTTHLDDDIASVDLYVPARTRPLFSTFSLSLSPFLLHTSFFFSETRTHIGADQVRISRPPDASRPPLSPSQIRLSQPSKSSFTAYLRPLFRSPINFDAPQCVSAPRLARSYRIGLSPAAKLDLTGLPDGRVITRKSYTVIKRGIEKRHTDRPGIADHDFKRQFFAGTIAEIIYYCKIKIYKFSSNVI